MTQNSGRDTVLDFADHLSRCGDGDDVGKGRKGARGVIEQIRHLLLGEDLGLNELAQLGVLSPPSDLAAIEKALAIVKVAIADLEESF